MNIFLAFPNFNIYSTPLLILVAQGLIFVFLLGYRFFKKRNISDLFLSLILLLYCYHQICYTVGFMEWYDTYTNTKINYFLIPISFAIAPLLYFYVTSITKSNFVFKRKDCWHFVPFLLFVTYRFGIYFYDLLQPGFDSTQNGFLKSTLDEPIILPIYMFVSFAQMLLYLAFTFQLFYNYRKRIQEYFSNTYKLELTWILSFLIVFSILFLYSSLQSVIGSLIIDLSYTQRWWYNLLMALVVLFVGIKGYFTDTTKLNKLTFSFSPNPNNIPEVNENNIIINDADLKALSKYMQQAKPYLNPELNLSDLATELHMNRAQLSQLINVGFQKNFNDFINEYRVNSVKEKLMDGKHQQLSLVGIAFDCGFNSKATFNRVFKKIAHVSPSEFLNSLS